MLRQFLLLFGNLKADKEFMIKTPIYFRHANKEGADQNNISKEEKRQVREVFGLFLFKR